MQTFNGKELVLSNPDKGTSNNSSIIRYYALKFNLPFTPIQNQLKYKRLKDNTNK